MKTIHRYSAAAALMCAAAAFAAIAPAPLGAAQYDVGTGPGCEASTLAAALFAAALTPEADVIRLTRTVTYTNISQTLTNWDAAGSGALTISGGWDSCTATTASGLTDVVGNGSHPVFTVEATAGRQSNVTFQRLRITGGGEGLLVTGDSHVDLVSVLVFGNASSGIRVSGGGDVDIDLFSGIIGNGPTTFGGGVYCTGAASRVTHRGIITDNTATSSGGGMFVDGGCLVTLAEGGWVQFNQAAWGGGVYVTGGADVVGGGTGNLGVVVSHNEATNEGGGFLVNGNGSTVALGNTVVSDNEAGMRGGGVAVGNSGSLHLERFNFQTCVSPPRCAVLSANRLTTGFEGSAAYASTGGRFSMYQGFIEQNAGPDEAGFLLFAEGTDTEMYLEGVQLWDNRTVSLFEAQDDAAIVAGFITAAGNDYLVGGGPTRLDSRGGQASGDATIFIGTSVLVDQRPFVANTGTIHSACLLVDTADGLTSSIGTMLVGVDPQFVSPASGNLRLRFSSPAIDSCNGSFFPPIDSDYDLDARGWDHPKVNDLGPFDLGADEVRPLFADGFESGNTSSWSSSIP